MRQQFVLLTLFLMMGIAAHAKPLNVLFIVIDDLRPEIGCYGNREKWPEIVTLPQLFRNNGYFTAGMGKILHMGLDENGKQTLFRDDLSYDH